jgi:hypothetical protein
VKSQIRNLRLALSLFVLRIRADHAHHAFAVDDLAVVAHLFNGSSYFHNPSTFSTGISGLNSNRRESLTEPAVK